MLPLIRKIAPKIPAIGRLLKHRNDLLEENIELRRQLSTRDSDHVDVLESRIDGLSTVINPSHYLDREWIDLHHDLSRYSIDKHCFQNFSGEIYRKGWEWTHCLYGLRKLGMLAPAHRALGVGVGRESVIYYLADYIAHVTATDLYGEATWSCSGGKEADLKMLEESKKGCPATVDFSKIRFENQNGIKLTYQDNLFDFAWSLSSIEHFGSHHAAAEAVREMSRVVRPGGIVAIATEMLLLEEYSHPEYFTRSEIMSQLIEPSTRLDLVDAINFNTLPYEFLLDSIVVPTGVDRRRRHVILNNGHVQWTSVIFFFRVKE